MGNPSPGLAQMWNPADLSLPRLTVEHSAPLRSVAYHPRGAVFQFTLPAGPTGSELSPQA